MKKKAALTGAQRDAALRKAAGEMAAKYGHTNVTRRQVAALAGVAESLVSQYLGTTEEIRKVAKAAARKAGLKEPTAKEQEAIGIELRKHKVRTKRDTRKRSVKEVEAIKRKSATKKSPATARKVIRGAAPKPAERKPTKPSETKPTAPKSKPTRKVPETKPTGPQERKSAAREPKAPPTVDVSTLPPLPKNLVGSFP